MEKQQELAARFRALHESGVFVIPNVWDGASAAIMARLGFKALATSSAACAATLGKLDGEVTREEALVHARLIVSLSDCPVSADLENGFGHAPETVADTIRLAIDSGLAGGSIEDASADPAAPIYDFSLAVERVQAAAEAARRLPVPFVLTARAEQLLYGVGTLDEAIRRLQAFEKAGADVLYAPGLRTREQIRTVVESVARPLNVVMGFADPTITLDELRELGVRRVSIGGGLSRVALRAFLDAAQEMRAGRFGFVERMATLRELFAAFPE